MADTIPVEGNLDLKGNHIKNVAIEVVTSLPTTNNFIGRQVTYQGRSYIWDGSVWKCDSDYLEIGGRNLVKNSGFTSTDGWRAITGSIIDINDGELSFSAGISSGWRALMSSSSNLINLEAGSFYTVSYQLMLTESTISDDFQLGFNRYGLPNPSIDGANISLNVRSQIDSSIVNEWQSIKATVKATHDVATSAYLRFGIIDSRILKVRRVKIEKGSIPTDWTPAPEDKADENQTINFDTNNIEPTQTGIVTKTSTWTWQYLTQSVNWLKANIFTKAGKLTNAVTITDFTTFNPATLGLAIGESCNFIAGSATGRPMFEVSTICTGKIQHVYSGHYVYIAYAGANTSLYPFQWAIGGYSNGFKGWQLRNAQGLLDLIKTVAGSGSGLDADLLDGLGSTDFAQLENGKIKASNLPDYLLGQVLYGGSIDSSQVCTLSSLYKDKFNTTDTTRLLANLTASSHVGVYFIASGNFLLNGTIDVNVGDWVISDGNSWGKIDNTDAVASVNGYTGVINLGYEDLGDMPQATDVKIGGIKIGFTAGNDGVIPILLDGNYKAYIELLAKHIRYAIANDTIINGNKYWLKNKTIIIPDGSTDSGYSEGLRIANNPNGYSVIALGTDDTPSGLNSNGKQWNIIKHPTGEFTISFDSGFDINGNKTGLTLYKNGDIYWKDAKLNLPRATSIVNGWLHTDDFINFSRIADHAQISLVSDKLFFDESQTYIGGHEIFVKGNDSPDFDDSGMYDNYGSYNLVASRRYEVIINMGMSIPVGGGLITLQLEKTGAGVIKSTPTTANEGYLSMSLSCIVDGGIPISVSIQKDAGIELNLEQNQCWFAVHEIK